MKPYLSLLIVRFKTMLQYRAAAIAGFLCQLFWGFILVMSFEAFFRSSTQTQPMDFHQTVNYIWLGQAFLGLLPWTVDSEMIQMVNTGSVAFEMLRPLDLHTFWFARSVAHRAAGAILRAVPMFMFTLFILPLIGLNDWALSLPNDPLQMATFLLSMTGVLLLSGAISTLANISLIWTISGRGLSVMLPAVVTIFSGMVIPLPFFPDQLQWFFNLLPFKGLCDGPYRIFIGNLLPMEYGYVLLHQAIWIFILILCGRLLVNRATQRMVIQGG